MQIVIAQLNPIVGDLTSNCEKITAAAANTGDGTDLVIFTELVVTGYPPEDLVLRPSFIEAVRKAVESLAHTTASGPALLISAPWHTDKGITNAALLLSDGKVTHVIPKCELPNDGVFDEKRIFTAGELPKPIEFMGHKLGIMTCEDMWFPTVSAHLKKHGADCLIALNASPFEVDKQMTRLKVARKRVEETGLPLIYTNQIGGQDEIIFDGASFVLGTDGTIMTEAQSHAEATLHLTFDGTSFTAKGRPSETFGKFEAIYHSLVLGVRDYVNKNGFKGVVLGLSGGVDSALTAAIAVDALGADRVRCIMMPSPYTSQDSLEDAKACAKALGVDYKSISIEPAMRAYDEMLSAGDIPNEGITAENIQSRTRGSYLMAVSNATGFMVLSTGNKSEMAVGYATLYGDMNGGFNPLKDVYKTLVFDLCHWRNSKVPKFGLGPDGEVIPERIITKPPSAELRPDQKDEDSLPPYPILDTILQGFIEDELSIQEIVDKNGYDTDTVTKVRRLLDIAEYKRRQACPGVKITRKAFGRDRRYPITQKFTE